MTSNVSSRFWSGLDALINAVQWLGPIEDREYRGLSGSLIGMFVTILSFFFWFPLSWWGLAGVAMIIYLYGLVAHLVPRIKKSDSLYKNLSQALYLFISVSLIAWWGIWATSGLIQFLQKIGWL